MGRSVRIACCVMGVRWSKKREKSILSSNQGKHSYQERLMSNEVIIKSALGEEFQQRKEAKFGFLDEGWSETEKDCIGCRAGLIRVCVSGLGWVTLMKKEKEDSWQKIKGCVRGLMVKHILRHWRIKGVVKIRGGGHLRGQIKTKCVT